MNLTLTSNFAVPGNRLYSVISSNGILLPWPRTAQSVLTGQHHDHEYKHFKTEKLQESDSLNAYKIQLLSLFVKQLCALCEWHHLWSLSPPSVSDRTDTAIDSTGTAGRNNTRILKLNHLPLCTWMGIGSHGKCRWRQNVDCANKYVCSLGLSLVLFVDLFLYLLEKCKKKRKLIPLIPYAIIRFATNPNAIETLRWVTEREKKVHEADVKTKCTAWLC